MKRGDCAGTLTRSEEARANCMNVDLIEFPIIKEKPPCHWRYRGLGQGRTYYANWALGVDIESFKECLLRDFYNKYHTKTHQDYHRKEVTFEARSEEACERSA